MNDRDLPRVVAGESLLGRTSMVRRGGKWLALPILTLASLPGVAIPQVGTAVGDLGTSGSASASGTPCPPGSSRLTEVEEGCFPANCVSLAGVIQGETISVPKFNPSLGTLTRVEVILEGEIDISLCIDNDEGICCPSVSYQAGGDFVLEPDPTNMPLLVMSPINLPNQVVGTVLNLAADDGDGLGNLDCSGNGGGCGGDDSVTIQENRTQASLPTIFSNPTAIRPFIRCPSEPGVVRFQTTMFETNSTNTFCDRDFSASVSGAARVQVTYFYCTNAPPVCAADAVSTPENAAVNIDVLANDFDPEGRLDCASIDIISSPPGSSVQLIACIDPPDTACPPGPSDCTGCRVRYTPPLDVCGSQQLSYRVSDLDGGTSDVCTITINVTPINEPPVAVNDAARTMEDTPVLIEVCANDFDPDTGTNCGAPIDCTTVDIVDPPDCGGTAFVNPDGTVTFTPPPGFCGICRFTYTVRDTQGLISNVANVTVTIAPMNDCPTAVNDSATTPEDQSVLINVCANDSDPDAANGCGALLDCTTVTIVSGSTCGGTAVVQPDGRVLFTPPANFCGNCQFTYRVFDTAGCASNVATVTVTVTPQNDCPTALNDSTTTNEDQSVLINVCANDTDPDQANGCGGVLDCTTVTIVSGSTCGGTAIVQPDGRVLFTPPAGFCGMCQFTYRVFDEAGCASNVATVTVTVLPGNDCPIAADDSATTQQGMAVLIPVCANDSDPDEATGCGAPLDCSTVVIVQGPNCNATAVATGNGNVLFTPAADECGVCNFTYRVSDTAGCQSNVARVSVTIVAGNQCPTAVNDSATTPENQFINIQVCANDFDPDGATRCGAPLDCCTVQIVAQPSCGATVTPAGCGTVNFTPPTDFCGTCFFTYRVSDTQGCVSNVATVTVTVTPINDPPFATDDAATTQINTPVVIDICANDGDPDTGNGCGAPLDCSTTTTVMPPDCGGQVVMNGDGTATFTPPPNFCGGDCKFTYRVFDTAGLVSNVATVTVTIECEPCDSPNRRNPGSLLLFPEFDNRQETLTMFTVTYAGVPGSPAQIYVEFVYIDKNGCAEFNRTEPLTKNDTITLITSEHNPEMERGYAYAFARCGPSNGSSPVVLNRLIGSLFAVDGVEVFAWSVNPLVFKGIGEGGGLCNGLVKTDIDGDGNLDLDDIEYEAAPDRLLIPRFMGQNDQYHSDLILIALSGGSRFETSVDFLVYNDNEEAFSSELVFDCWTRKSLLSISNLFSQDFLVNGTNQDPEEILGDPTLESGWIRLDGNIAQSSTTVIVDPAIYAVLVEGVGADNRYVADLPFELCTQRNGSLLPRTNSGQ